MECLFSLSIVTINTTLDEGIGNYLLHKLLTRKKWQNQKPKRECVSLLHHLLLPPPYVPLAMASGAVIMSLPTVYVD